MSPYMMGLAAPSPVSANIRVFHSESGGTTAQTKGPADLDVPLFSLYKSSYYWPP